MSGFVCFLPTMLPQWETKQMVLVDDTDPRLLYDGNWSPEIAGWTVDWGEFGKAYNDTLHKVVLDGNVHLKFNGAPYSQFFIRSSILNASLGSHITIKGSIDTTEGRPKPSWICVLDNKESKKQQ